MAATLLARPPRPHRTYGEPPCTAAPHSTARIAPALPARQLRRRRASACRCVSPSRPPCRAATPRWAARSVAPHTGRHAAARSKLSVGSHPRAINGERKERGRRKKERKKRGKMLGITNKEFAELAQHGQNYLWASDIQSVLGPRSFARRSG
uniref:Uncharacterized protein n=1 Tax=Oryza rufipogon TaxID=4529 RepID=A0A0E0QP13_ORYRU